MEKREGIAMKNLNVCSCLHSHICPHVLSAMGLYLHILPGRLRLDIPGLRHGEQTVAAIEASLANLPGVRKVQCSTRTGRALIELDSRQVQVESILDAAFEHAQSKAHSSSEGGFGVKSWVANSVLGQAAGFVLENAVKLALGI
jgi:copper chaperone CopZ